MNRGINRQEEARLGMGMTDLQGVCVCVFFLNPWAPEWGQLQCSKRNTLLNTHSQINMNRFSKARNHYGNAKMKGSKNTVLFLPLFQGELRGNSGETTG